MYAMRAREVNKSARKHRKIQYFRSNHLFLFQYSNFLAQLCFGDKLRTFKVGNRKKP